MNGIGDTWRPPRRADVAPGPFSRLIEVAAQTARIESEFRLHGERQRHFETQIDMMLQAVKVRMEKLETQVSQPVADAIAQQLNALRNELCDLINQAVRSALAAELADALQPLRDQLSGHDMRLAQLEDHCQPRPASSSGKQEKAK